MLTVEINKTYVHGVLCSGKNCVVTLDGEYTYHEALYQASQQQLFREITEVVEVSNTYELTEEQAMQGRLKVNHVTKIYGQASGD